VRQLSEGADAESPIASAAEVDALFARVDRDGDGRIDFLEFVQAVTADK
jgi:Ca2+-binding EF-hand superfamily protein